MRGQAMAVVLAGLAQAAQAGPAEAPPEDFTGPEYVDSAGCHFWRAQLAGQTLWAEVIGADGQPVCDAPPPVAEVDPNLSPSDALPALAPTRRGVSPTFPQDGRYAQVGAFTSTRKADEIVLALQEAGFSVLRQDFSRGSGRLRVLFVGPLGDQDRAQARLRDLRSLGFRDAFLRVQAPS